MEKMPDKADFRVVWNVVGEIGKGVYIHIPIHFAKMARLKSGDQLDLTIWRFIPKDREEIRKK